MITIDGLQIKSLAEAPETIVRILKKEFRVKDLSVLSIQEKAAVINRMHELGLFSMRSSVQFASDVLDVCKVTVYKRLNAIECPK